MKILLLIFSCLFLCSCGPDLSVRTDKPLTLEEARKHAKTDFPFPATAHNVYYAVYNEWETYECLIRFDAPPADCEASIARVLAWHQKAMRNSTVYQPKDFSGNVANSALLRPAPWFDGAAIKRGLFAGEDVSHAPSVWVDLEKGRFYYRSAN